MLQKTVYPKWTNIGIRNKVHNIIETYKGINKVRIQSSGAYKNNPYNKFISHSIDATFNYIKTPIESLVKSKIKEISILKKLKLG